ncbi:hypothetical protein ABIC83_003028 [Roseateles asaccharophilus]|uniref:B12-binding domain-containing radical SAM protein n=1 Tax=Roseateles asaccharophilus TaxID=582607 RepID=UPI003833BC2D
MTTKVTSTKARVLHMRMPGALTTTTRAFDFRNEGILSRHGVCFDHVDLGHRFWNHVLQRLSGITMEALFDAESCRSAAPHLAVQLKQSSNVFGFELAPSGFNFGALSSSTFGISEVISNVAFMSLMTALVDEVKEDLADIDLISIGTESPESVLFGAAFTAALRTQVRPTCQIVLGKSSYENFSLVFRSQDLEANGQLAKHFDGVFPNEEYFADRVLDALGIARMHEAVAVQMPSGRKSPEPLLAATLDRFVKYLGARTENCPLFMPLSRNKCYWKKCTFCVQIKRHVADRFYDEAAELESAFRELELYGSLGFKYIIFSDEAISPSNIRKLCDYLESSPYEFRWSVRIIADVKFKPDLIARMKALGCIEVLFGLETVSKSTAKSMAKVSDDASEEDIYDLLRRFSSAGIGIFLNAIYGFPTEPDEEFKPTLDFVRRVKTTLDGVTVQMNKFGLFYGTDIHADPQRFGLVQVEQIAPRDDLRLVVDYVDSFGRQGLAPGNLDHFLESLNVDRVEFDRNCSDAYFANLVVAFQLNYASFGLIHKDRRQAALVDDLLQPRTQGLEVHEEVLG